MGVAIINKKPFNLTIQKRREAPVLSSILDYLRRAELGKRVIEIERRNGGSIRDHGGKFRAWAYTAYLPNATEIHKGVADIEGVLCDGRKFRIEVKSPDNATALNNEQKIIAEHCQKYSIPHLVARSVDDVVAWLDAVFPKK